MTRRLILASLLAGAVLGGVAAEARQNFHLISWLFSEAQWKQFTALEPPATSIDTALLQSPQQIIFIYNGWSLRGGVKDARITDLEQRVLRPQVTFARSWPTYTSLGYVAAIETSSGDWALVAEMSRHHIVEYRSRIGVTPRDIP